jgi:sterol desaturase/sphingolipid hydroxylase (fatty acid hydroxylase superfamily)
MRGEHALAFALVAFAFAGLEAWWRRRSGRSYDLPALKGTLGVAVGQVLVNGLAGIGITAVYTAAWTASPLRMPLDAAWSWGLLFLASEFLYYWQHRMSHEVRWLWATHSVHHSAEEFTLPAAFRLGWTGWLSGLWLFFLPLPLLGWHPAAVAAVIAVNLRFQYYLHSELPPWLGPLEWIFNTPSAHRVHHASNPAYIDRNFGGVLIVFDRLFGTYARETADDPCRYGLVDPVRSNNPFVIAFHEWGRLLTAMRRAGSPLKALGIAAGYPGVRPERAPHAAPEARS